MSYSKRAIFTSSNGAYFPFLNAFLNSLDKQAAAHAVYDVYLLHWDMPLEYLQAIDSASWQHIRVFPEAIGDDKECHWRSRFKTEQFSNMEICKAGRYHHLKEITAESNTFTAVCLMDCDLMVVSPDFFNLFELVENTELAIGCNEGFKWAVGPNFLDREGQPLFEKPHRLMKFSCNTPLFIGSPSGHRWQSVLEKYLEIVYQATEMHPAKGPCKVGDIFAWNFAVDLCDMAKNVMLFPMEVMTQVHQTAYKGSTKLRCSNGYYHTEAGDPVLSLHGRCGRGGFGTYKPEKIGVPQGVIDQVNEIFRQEWYDLNFRQRLKLTDVVPMQPLWQEWLEKHRWSISE